MRNQLVFTPCLFIASLLLLSCMEPSSSGESKPVVQKDSLVSSSSVAASSEVPSETRIGEISTPTGFSRIPVDTNSFANYLREQALKPADSPVLLYNGELKVNQTAHFAVVDLPIGQRDLHQCADAVMRLKADYHYQRKEFDQIHFNFTSGDRVGFADWAKGRRPKVRGNRVVFTNGDQTPDYQPKTYWSYLETIFMYAGTASLSKELQPVEASELQIGDVFIQGGFPGHAVIVVDMARNEAGATRFLLAQSYMPAQELHVLNNFKSSDPWYPLDQVNQPLSTPEWVFDWTDLKRFR